MFLFHMTQLLPVSLSIRGFALDIFPFSCVILPLTLIYHIADSKAIASCQPVMNFATTFAQIPSQKASACTPS